MSSINSRLIAAILVAHFLCAGFCDAQGRVGQLSEAAEQYVFEDPIEGVLTVDFDAYLVAQQDDRQAQQEDRQEDQRDAPRETPETDDRTRRLDPEPLPSRTPPRNPDLTSARSRFRQSYQRLARAPDIFGDANITLDVDTGVDFFEGELPAGGRAQLLKVSDNNTAVPRDRAYFVYNHFHNALDFERRPPAGGPGFSQSFDVNRFTLGLEKTFFCGCQSVEVRLPLIDRFDSARPDLLLADGSWGDVGVIFKRVVYRDACRVVSAGFGLDLPTGSDTRGTLPARAMRFEIGNQAVHLLPYVGFTSSREDGLFQHGFVQLDVPLNGDRIEVVDTATPARSVGHLLDQVLLELDYSIGYWHFRDTGLCGRGITGLASVVELHYTVPFGGGDVVRSLPAAAPAGPVFRSDLDELGVLNVTFGLHAEFNRCTALRIGMAFPFRGGDNRFFDAELIASLVRRF